MGQILSSDVKKSLLSCGSTEELYDLAKRSGYELCDEELVGVSGGTCIRNQCRSYDPRRCPDYRTQLTYP